MPTAAKVTHRVPVLGLWTVEATPLRRSRTRRRVRRGRHRTQPRRRGGSAVRQHAALGCRVPGRQLPVLPARDGFPKKVKPLVRLTEREMAAWCIVRGIDYQVEECPMAAGNKHLAYKAALNAIERDSPGSKAAFYLNFVERMAPLLAGAEHSRRRRSARRARSAARRPPARSAPSAGSRSGWQVNLGYRSRCCCRRSGARPTRRMRA